MSYGARQGSTRYLLQRLGERRFPMGIYPYNMKRKINKRHKEKLRVWSQQLRSLLDQLDAKLGDTNGTI